MTPLEARSLFPITRSRIFMNHAGVSAWSQPVREAVDRVSARMTEGGFDGEAYQADTLGLREGAARLYGGRVEDIALTRATSSAISIVAAGLDWRPGENVVTARLEYPANLYPWLAQADRGVETRLVEPVEGRVTPEAIFALTDSRTRVVALSWIAFWNGFRADIETIGAECRRRGILFCVDAIQGLGAFRFPAGSVDFAAAGGGKWLLGMPGMGISWFTPALVERLRPPLVGTHSVKEPQEYFKPVLEWNPTAARFEEAVHSWPNLAGQRAAVELLLEVGLEAIEPRVTALAGRLAEGLAAAGCEMVGPWPRDTREASGIVSFRVPGEVNVDTLARLTAAGVVCRNHSDFVRLSPTFYNTEEEVDQVIALVREGLDRSR